MRTSSLAATKSLRPKEYKRDDYASTFTKPDLDRFAEAALSTLRFGIPNVIMDHMLLDKFERFVHFAVCIVVAFTISYYIRNTYKADAKITMDIEREEEEKRHRRQELRDSLISTFHGVHEHNTHKFDEMTGKWKATQRVKRNRRIRDTQFELAQMKIEELKRTQQRLLHNRDERKGIEDFEKNMKRMGISGSDGGDERMSISYETPAAYEQRLQERSAVTLPTDEEINNFQSQLKERTASKRLARYEKARRRRRAMADPTNALKNQTQQLE